MIGSHPGEWNVFACVLNLALFLAFHREINLVFTILTGIVAIGYAVGALSRVL